VRVVLGAVDLLGVLGWYVLGALGEDVRGE
jgi:hypothetical protein